MKRYSSRNSTRCVFASKFNVGDIVEYDGNARGVYPKLGIAKVVSIKPGLAGHGDYQPDPIYVLESPKTGDRFSVDEFAIQRIVDSSSRISRSRRVSASRRSAGRYVRANRFVGREGSIDHIYAIADGIEAGGDEIIYDLTSDPDIRLVFKDVSEDKYGCQILLFDVKRNNRNFGQITAPLDEIDNGPVSEEDMWAWIEEQLKDMFK